MKPYHVFLHPFTKLWIYIWLVGYRMRRNTCVDILKGWNFNQKFQKKQIRCCPFNNILPIDSKEKLLLLLGTIEISTAGYCIIVDKQQFSYEPLCKFFSWSITWCFHQKHKSSITPHFSPAQAGLTTRLLSLLAWSWSWQLWAAPPLLCT